MRSSSKPRPRGPVGKSKYSSRLAPCLALNQEYCGLLSKLIHTTYPLREHSNKAYYFDLLGQLRDIRACLRKELQNSQSNSQQNVLADFIRERDMHNAGNLIGRLEQISNCASIQITKSSKRKHKSIVLNRSSTRLPKPIWRHNYSKNCFG